MHKTMLLRFLHEYMIYFIFLFNVKIIIFFVHRNDETEERVVHEWRGWKGARRFLGKRKGKALSGSAPIVSVQPAARARREEEDEERRGTRSGSCRSLWNRGPWQRSSLMETLSVIKRKHIRGVTLIWMLIEVRQQHQRHTLCAGPCLPKSGRGCARTSCTCRGNCSTPIYGPLSLNRFPMCYLPRESNLLRKQHLVVFKKSGTKITGISDMYCCGLKNISWLTAVRT